MQPNFNLNKNSFTNAFYFVSGWGTRELPHHQSQYAEDGQFLAEVF